MRPLLLASFALLGCVAAGPDDPFAPVGPMACATPAPNAMALVDVALVTHAAVADGPWSEASTWRDGAIPPDGARAHVPPGLRVTLDGTTARLETLRVDGTLRFATDAATELRVDTLVSTASATLEIGTASAPIAASARITFIDDGPVDPRCDPSQVSRGAMLMGTTRIHGAPRAHGAVLAEPARAGATELVLDRTPEGWVPGDALVVTGTVAGDPESDEVRRIARLEGSSVRLDAALARDHAPATSGLRVWVANVTRNVVFASDSPSLAHRGHVMFMRTPDLDVRFARFEELGRTDKTRPLDDLFFEVDDEAVGNATSAFTVFSVTEGARTNVRGRYPVHLHRLGTDPTSTPAHIEGSVVWGSPGWGFVMHSSHASFVRNVTYGVQGTGFYTEAGDEVGTLRENLAVRSVNPVFAFDSEGGAIDPDLGAENQEFGNDGDGYWLSGHGVSLIDNVAAGATAHGFIYWTDGLVEADVPVPARMSVRSADVANGELLGERERIPTWWAPLAEIRGNESYGASIGFRMRYTHAQTYIGEGGSAFHERPPEAYIDTLRPTVEDLTVWNCRDGVMMNYTARMSVRRARIVGIGAPFVLDGGTANSGVGLDLGTEVTNGFGRIEDVSIEGFAMGFVLPRNDQWVIDGLVLRNADDLYVAEPRQGPRSLTMRDVRFEDLAGTAAEGMQRRNVVMAADSFPDGYQPFAFLLPDRVTLNGQGLYFDLQGPDQIPLTSLPDGEDGDEPNDPDEPEDPDEPDEPEDPEEPEEEDPFATIPARYVGRTNAELQASEGLSFGGALPPADAVRAPWLVGGVVGSPAPAPTVFPPLFDMTNEGGSPEPLPGTPIPELTANRLRVRTGRTEVLQRSDLHVVDLDTPTPELVLTVSDVRGGRFVHRDAPDVALTRFTQAEVDGGVVRFVHEGGDVGFSVAVTDGTTTLPPAPAIIERVP
ncbi:MAG: cadherin-like domain-containing protein [Myxococcota bacterium]